MKNFILSISLIFLFTTWSEAQANHCLDLDGNNNFIQVDNFSLGGDFTIGTWFKCNDFSNAPNEERIISFGPGVRLEIGIQVDNNRLWIFDQSFGSIQEFGTDLRDAAWHHVAFVKSGDDRLIYLDGAFVGQYTTGSYPYGNHFRLGAWTGSLGTHTFFNGLLDETQVYNIAKNEEEVVKMMSCPLTGDEENLLVYWNYDQGISAGDNSGETTLIDRSNNNRDGTLHSFALTGNQSNWLASENPYLNPLITQSGNELIANTDLSVSYQWVDCNDNFSPIPNETNQTFIPTDPGNYAVEVNDGMCTKISDCFELINVSTDQITEEFQTVVYPNPSLDALYIKTTNFEQKNIEIFSLTGVLLLTKSSTSLITKIDLTDLVAGAYFIKIKHKEYSVFRKFIKS